MIKRVYKYFIHQYKIIFLFFEKIIYKIKIKFTFSKFQKLISFKEFEKHCLITWMTWSGKSELMKYLIYYFIYRKKRSSIILCDPHGDVADEIFNHKYLNHTEVVYFHPLLFQKWVFGINPFWYELNDNEIEVYAGELALVFEEMIKSKPSLTLNMKSLLVPCIIVLLKRKNSSLKDLQRFMSDNNEDLVELGLKSINPSISNFFKYHFNDPIYSITKQSINVKIQSLLNSHIFTKITTSNKTINLKELIENEKIIIFNLSKWLLWSDVSQALWRFIVALSQSIAISRAKQPKSSRVHTYLFIDEFTNYTTKSIKAILEESRKYHLHLIIATQLLWKNIDPILRETILSNSNVKIIWANSYSQQLSLSKESWIPKDKLLSLKIWTFYIKSKFIPYFLFKVPSIFIWDRYKLSISKIKKLHLFQQQKYYFQEDEEIEIKPLFKLE